MARHYIRPEQLFKLQKRGCTTYADLGTRKIAVSESHLAFLWAYIYSHFVIYEECVQRPMLSGEFDGRLRFESRLTQRARRLQEWTLSFSQAFCPWPEHLPSPAKHEDENEKSYGGKANNLYLKAVCFVLLHEFAHLTLQHSKDSDAAWSLDQEREADNFAITCLLGSSVDELQKTTIGAAITLLHSSNLFLASSFAGIWQARHPNVHDRIRNSVSGLNLKSEKSKFYIYYLASMAVRQYLERAGHKTSLPTLDTAEDLFHEYLDVFDSHKGGS